MEFTISVLYSILSCAEEHPPTSGSSDLGIMCWLLSFCSITFLGGLWGTWSHPKFPTRKGVMVQVDYIRTRPKCAGTTSPLMVGWHAAIGALLCQIILYKAIKRTPFHRLLTYLLTECLSLWQTRLLFVVVVALQAAWYKPRNLTTGKRTKRTGRKSLVWERLKFPEKGNSVRFMLPDIFNYLNTIEIFFHAS